MWPENKADQSNVNVLCHMSCAKVIFEACHDPNTYLLFYTLHRNEVSVDGAERKICCIVLLLLLDIV